MIMVNIDHKLSDIVINEPSVLTVLNRFDIFLGMEDRTVADVCMEKGLDPIFFQTILNVYLNDSYFPEDTLKSFSASKIIEYLNKTNAYYQQFQIPNIERHFNSLINRSDAENCNLELIRDFFLEVKAELLQRIAVDNKIWFPTILKLEQEKCAKSQQLLCQTEKGADNIEDKLGDLISMFVIHLKGNYDSNLGYAVLVAIITLQRDVRKNNRIRNRILKPLTESLLEKRR